MKDIFTHYKAVISNDKGIKGKIDSDQDLYKKVSDLSKNLKEKNCIIKGEKIKKELIDAICLDLAKETKHICLTRADENFKWHLAREYIYGNCDFEKDHKHYFIIEDCHNKVVEVHNLLDHINGLSLTNARFLFTLKETKECENLFSGDWYVLNLQSDKEKSSVTIFAEEYSKQLAYFTSLSENSASALNRPGRIPLRYHIEVPQLQRLKRMLKSNAKINDNLFVILGEPGIGKSALLQKLTQWCLGDEGKNLFFPITLESYAFNRLPESLYDYLGCEYDTFDNVLTSLSNQVKRKLVFFVDALDALLERTDNNRTLTPLLWRLTNYGVVVCSSRPVQYKNIKNDLSNPHEIELEKFQIDEVKKIIREYQLHVDSFDPDVLDLCRNPFLLYLLLDLGMESAGLQAVTGTDLMQRYWEERISNIKRESFSPSIFGGLTPEEVGLKRGLLASEIAEVMLAEETYEIDLDYLKEKYPKDRFPITIIRQLLIDGVIKETKSRTNTYIKFMHNRFTESVIAREYRINKKREVASLINQLNKGFYVKIVVELIQQSIDKENHELEDELYEHLIKTLEMKAKGRHEMDIAWGTSDVLKNVNTIWARRMCNTICEPNINLSIDDQNLVASSVADALIGVHHPNLTSALKWGAKYYPKRRRLIEGLGVSGDPNAVDFLLEFLESTLTKMDDSDIIVDVVKALGELGNPKAKESLEKLVYNSHSPNNVRRATYKALYKIFGEPLYKVDIECTEDELVDRLDVHRSMPNGKKVPSDWKRIVSTCEWLQTHEFSTERILSALVKAANHDHERARGAAVNTLAVLGDMSVIESLFSMFEKKETSPIVKRTIVKAAIDIVLKVVKYEANVNEIVEQVEKKLRMLLRYENEPSVKRTLDEKISELRKVIGKG